MRSAFGEAFRRRITGSSSSPVHSSSALCFGAMYGMRGATTGSFAQAEILMDGCPSFGPGRSGDADPDAP
jgi:hypothetical protein